MKTALSLRAVLLLVAMAAGFASGSGCVPRERWDELVALEHQEKAAADRDRLEAASAFSKHGEMISSLSVELYKQERAASQCDVDLSLAQVAKHNAETALDESTAIGEQLRHELTRIGTDVNKLLSDRGALSTALASAKERLAELRKVEEAHEAEKLLFRTFEKKLSRLVAAHQVRIEGDAAEGGHLRLVLDGDLVFNEGKSDIRSAGRGAVLEVARLLSDTKGRHFFVTVYSDEKVSKGKQVPWELSAARSVTLVRLLIEQHVPAEHLTSGGAIATTPPTRAPVEPKETWQRRIEISVIPESVALP